MKPDPTEEKSGGERAFYVVMWLMAAGFIVGPFVLWLTGNGSTLGAFIGSVAFLMAMRLALSRTKNDDKRPPEV